MTIAAVASVLLRDHWRRGGVLAEAVLVSMIIGIFLDPRRRPYEAPYLATAMCLAAPALAAVVAFAIASRAGHVRAEAMLLAGGRAPYYVGALLATLVSSLTWLGLMSLLLPLLASGPLGPDWAGRVALAAVLNAVLSAALCCALSPLTGWPFGPVLAIVALVLGVSRSWFAGLSSPELRHLALLVPQLLENTRAAAGGSRPLLAGSLVYSAAATALGLWRFVRREFYWS